MKSSAYNGQIFCCQCDQLSFVVFKVAQFIQYVVGTWLAHSLSHFSSIPPLEIEAQPTQIALHHNQKPLIQFCGYLFFFLLNALILDHILRCLPMTPSML